MLHSPIRPWCFAPRFWSFVLLGALVAAAPTAKAVVTIEYLVLGTFLNNSVDGSLVYNNNATNVFSPTSALVVDPAAEFVYADATRSLTANFDTTGRLDLTATNPDPFQLIFKSPIFVGKELDSIFNVPDTFPGGLSSSLVGDTITINFGGGAPGTYAASFAIVAPGASAVPLPAAVWAGLALGAAVVARKRRSSRAS
ncbi:MAG: hypothetical protein ACAI43_24495 [Phycisphaerae bacterium]